MTADALVAALQQLQQQLMNKSDELHAEARKMKHFASQEYCDGKARGLQFSAQELSALLGRMAEEDKADWLTTSDPRVVAVMGSVPECAANGCQFRKTSGYRPGQKADFPGIYPGPLPPPPSETP